MKPSRLREIVKWSALVLVILLQTSSYTPSRPIEETKTISLYETFPSSMWKEFSPRFIVEYRNHVLLRCEEYGIPPKIALGMILTESQGNPLAVGKNISSEGKLLSTDRGIMQLNSMYFADKIKRRIPGTDTIYEYQPFIYVYDNIDLGLQYLVEMHQKFGNWPQAIQAYNCGPTAVLNKQIPKRTVKYLDSVLLFTSLY